MRALLTGDSHLARAVRQYDAIAPGWTSRAVGGSVAPDLAGQVAGLSPDDFDVVVVSIGTNDAGWRNVPLVTFTGALDRFVAWAGSTPVLLITSPGCDESRADAHWSSARLASYAAAASRLVLAAGGDVLDTPALLGPLGAGVFVEDGFHLTAASYDLLLPALRKAVADR